jgi:5'-methylthioadenosine phosphorylase
MDATFACIAGEEIHRQCDVGKLDCKPLEPRDTPFGPSGQMYLISDSPHPYYLMPRYGVGMHKRPARSVNSRANIYALKDLGVQSILELAPAGAITHTHGIGDMDICGDLIDRTTQRQNTFFEDSPLGFLRQFPVFCPRLRDAAAEALTDLDVTVHVGGTTAIMEGPRLETPAEVRMLAHHGADTVSHMCVPEVFLARELEMCYQTICYIVSYAETGSRYRPFQAGALFGGHDADVDGKRLAKSLGLLGTIIERVAATKQACDTPCECEKSQSDHVRDFHLGENWRDWFSPSQ